MSRYFVRVQLSHSARKLKRDDEAGEATRCHLRQVTAPRLFSKDKKLRERFFDKVPVPIDLIVKYLHETDVSNRLSALVLRKKEKEAGKVCDAVQRAHS